MYAMTVSLMIAPWNSPWYFTTPSGSSSSVGRSSRPAPGVASTLSFGASPNHSLRNSQQIACVAAGSSLRNARSERTVFTSAPRTSPASSFKSGGRRRNGRSGQLSQMR